MADSLVFDGHVGSTPCFFKAPEPPPPLPSPESIPDGYLAPPLFNSRNDMMQMQKVAMLSETMHPSRIPPLDACKVSPPGFACGPLPALPGQVVKCVPSMNQTNLNQLSARVLPYTVSRANGVLDNPDHPDPRFSVFPKSFPSAYSRCCAGVMSKPVDVQPIQCGSRLEISNRMPARLPLREVDAMKLGFRSRPDQLQQLKITDTELHRNLSKSVDQSALREHVWRDEARRAKVVKSDIGALVPIFTTMPNRTGWSQFI